MASAGQVDVKVAVKPKVAIGTSTVAGGSVSLVAFVVAAVAFWQGARDEATISALTVGLVSLVTVLGGRYAQAVAALLVVGKKPALAAPLSYSATGTTGTLTNLTIDGPAFAKGVMSHHDDNEPGDPDALPDYTTDENVPPDIGDTSANGATGERES